MPLGNKRNQTGDGEEQGGAPPPAMAIWENPRGYTNGFSIKFSQGVWNFPGPPGKNQESSLLQGKELKVKQP